MKKLLFTIGAMLFACAASASAIDWSVNLQGNADLNAKWADSTVYSYVMLGSSVGPAMTPDTFMTNWSAEYAGTATELIGDVKAYLPTEALTGAVDGWTNNPFGGSYAVYLVLVMVKDNEGMYASYGTDVMGGLFNNVREDNAGSSIDKIVGFTDASSWTAFTVPEPTALALLALGVAGLALKRKNV